ncbi:carbohydrate ABC transporter permease [Paenibacillus sp. J5C_2022]|uniref:carbohydrate ABC transporter permease n=1 Tax=Paenibacillus sp. J5C2022 TaxID=2977129 RepID=UPI0021CE79CF|nr:carbohydrate ABC transporter permease [Paenibacillus sp. J5C2022]MCU6709768.1 carbohydrate ABC transporter permease [Paenibacillus sp. J5C2022]
MMGSRIYRPIAFYLIASLLAFFALLPFIWMLSTSLKTDGAYLEIPIKWIPDPFSLEAYEKLFSLFPFGKAIANSLYVTAMSTLITLISASMAAYIFAKVNFKGREVVFALFLATMMVPTQVTTIPIFLILKEMHLVNTFTGLMMPSIFNAFAVFMLRQYMMTLHDDFLDAAFMDGASHVDVFRKIIIPLSMPIVMTLAVLTVMNVWGDYFWPLIVLSEKEKMTLPLALGQLNGQFESKYNVLMAGSLISMLPIIVLYLFAQRYFKSGLQLGGIK